MLEMELIEPEMFETELIEPEMFEMELAGQMPSIINGTTNYNELDEKPSINNVELKGNKTLEELGIDLDGTLQNAKDYADSIKPTKTSELTNDSGFITENDIPDVDLTNYYTKEEIDNNFYTKFEIDSTLGDIQLVLNEVV